MSLSAQRSFCSAGGAVPSGSLDGGAAAAHAARSTWHLMMMGLISRTSEVAQPTFNILFIIVLTLKQTDGTFVCFS